MLTKGKSMVMRAKGKSILKGFFHFFGLDVRRAKPHDMHEWLKSKNIRTVIDVGANIGQFATLIHKVLPAAMIYSFEPLEDCYKELKRRMHKVNNFEALNLALTDFNGELEFHRNVHSPSSSALAMTDVHKHNYPFAARAVPIKVQSMRLDDAAKKLEIKDDLLIKIDVQGLEDKVLAGGKNTIKQAAIVIIETSFQVLYAGQPLFEDIYDLLKQDFRYVGCWEKPRIRQIDSSPLFEDAVFINKRSELSI